MANLDDKDMESVAYGRALRGCAKFYVVGLVLMILASIPAVAFKSWLWSALYGLVAFLFAFSWYLKVYKSAKAIKVELLRPPKAKEPYKPLSTIPKSRSRSRKKSESADPWAATGAEIHVEEVAPGRKVAAEQEASL